MNRRVAVLTAFLILASSLAAVTSAPFNDMQVRVFVDNQDQWQQLHTLDLDVVWTDKTYVDIFTNPDQLVQVQQAGFKTETVHESVSSFYRSRLPQKTMGGYKTLSEIYAYLDGVIADHPDIVSPKQSIGLTLEGRDMWAVKISDNPSVDEDEPEVLFTAGIHCREVATPEILFNYMNYLTNNYATVPEVKQLVDNREIWFILACNPDGYAYNEYIAPEGLGMWRKNRRDNGDGTFGVDLNRNFGYMWGYDNSGSSPNGGSESYRGAGPFSEPETQHLRDFTLSHDFALTCYYHSYQNVFIYPWGYRPGTCPDDDIYAAMGDSILAMNGYVHGPVSTLMYAVNGGSFDWEYGDQASKPKILGTSIEAGSAADGFWPTLARLEVLKQENLGPMLFLTRMAGDINSFMPPQAPQIVNLPSSVNGSEYVVEWAHNDTDNPAVLYELIELQKRRDLTDRAETLNSWDADQFAVSTSRAWSSPASLYSGAGNNYTARLETSFPHTVKPGEMLTFYTYVSMEIFRDFGYVAISTDGQSFTSLPGNITYNLNPYGGNRGNGITGQFNVWRLAEFDLSAFVDQPVWFRFTYETNGSNISEGWYIDDIFPHLVFESEVVITSDLEQSSYTFSDKPMGVYSYAVRARDAQNQWSSLSPIVETDVLGQGVGDVDLDGINSSVADLANFSLYFAQGPPAFDVYPEVQVAETDANCDDLSLTIQDLDILSQVVVGSQTACYASSTPDPRGGFRSRATESLSDRPAPSSKSSGESAYKVELQSTSFRNDSAWVDVVLTRTNAGLLGFQFHLEFDASALSLESIQLGGTLSNWQFFDHNLVQTGATADLKIAALAQYRGGPILASDINLQPTPVTLVHLKFGFLTPDLSEPISFVWDNCTDNALVGGRFEGETLVIDSLLLSESVFGPDGTDVTALTPRYGGADYTCFYGMFGNTPAPTVDFAGGQVSYVPSCCLGHVGDANGQGGDEPTISDISTIVDHLFINRRDIACIEEADVNQSGGENPTAIDITISDVSVLVDHLFVNRIPLRTCL
ncbi:MAG: M14 family zinc carboxypeptidase [candidate division Zixibacteria bacterium]|nr:M14 family zinc carboxypeptidase [candidate division Zixibacteria bacterium]